MAPQLRYDERTGSPYAVERALCEDGKRRYAKISGNVKSEFRMPASVKVKANKAAYEVSGWVTDDGEGDFVFFANPTGKNAHHILGKK